MIDCRYTFLDSQCHEICFQLERRVQSIQYENIPIDESLQDNR